MLNIITEKDPVVFHNQAPSHGQRPDWVTDAQETAKIAWTQHDEAVEAYLAGRTGIQAANTALAQAQAAQQYAEDMIGYWLSGYEPVSVQPEVIDITVSF